MQQESRLVVVDASVVLKWQLNDEEYIDQVMALRDDFYLYRVIGAIAPQLLAYEVVNGMVIATRQNRATADDAIEGVNNLSALGIELREIKPLRILELSLKYRLAAYDAAYLILAEDEKCDLWTADRAFYQAVKKESRHVNWIGDYRTRAMHIDHRSQ